MQHYRTINGNVYPLEMQLFAKNSQNLIVISYFFMECESKNVQLEPLVEALASVQSVGDKRIFNRVPTFPLDRFLPRITTDFYGIQLYLNVGNDVETHVHFLIDATALILIGTAQLKRIQAIQRIVRTNMNGCRCAINEKTTIKLYRQSKN